MKKTLLIGFLAIIVTGCVGNDVNTVTPPVEAPTPFATPTTLPEPTATRTPDVQPLQSEIQTKWENGSHAQAVDSVHCDTCHQLQNGVVTSNIAWWNQDAGQYESVTENSNLCRNCHAGYDYAQAAHENLTCLDCHDQHSTSASCFDCHGQIKAVTIQVPSTPVDGHPNGVDAFCNGSGCHSVATQVAEMPSSVHGEQHATVTCAACHDAQGLQVGPMEDGSAWVSWHKSELEGERTSMPFYSHNLQYEVDCKRCHYENNPWDLRSMDSGHPGN